MLCIKLLADLKLLALRRWFLCILVLLLSEIQV